MILQLPFHSKNKNEIKKAQSPLKNLSFLEKTCWLKCLLFWRWAFAHCKLHILCLQSVQNRSSSSTSCLYGVTPALVLSLVYSTSFSPFHYQLTVPQFPQVQHAPSLPYPLFQALFFIPCTLWILNCSQHLSKGILWWSQASTHH